MVTDGHSNDGYDHLWTISALLFLDSVRKKKAVKPLSPTSGLPLPE